MSSTRVTVWPPLAPTVFLRPASSSLPFPLEEERCRVFARARHGLWQGVQALGLGIGDVVLTPAFHHGSEVEALIRAGLEPRFYAGTTTLEPDEQELDRLLTPSVRALYLTHFLGFPQDAPRWRRWCDERGLLLIEDAAQAWLSSIAASPVGSLGDLAIFCLYKAVGVPDGGAMVVRAPAPGPEQPSPVGAGRVLRRHASWAAQRSAPIATLIGRGQATRQDYSPEADFALGDPGSAPCALSLRLLPRILDGGEAERRRMNYGILLDELGSAVRTPFDRVPPGASPMALPLDTNDKGCLIRRLGEAGIVALDLWSVPHPALHWRDFPAAHRLRSRTVAVPVHQELRPAELERIVASARLRRRAVHRPRLEYVQSLDALRDEWSPLAGASSNIFATWEWIDTWWRHFGAGRPLRVVACRSPTGRLRAVLPLYMHSTRPLRIVRFLGHGPSDQGGPVCAPSDRPWAADALRRAVHDVRADLLVADNVAAEDRWSAVPGARILATAASPLLAFDGRSWEQILASRSRNLRQQVGRFERKLAREHGLRYRLTSRPEALEQDLELLFSLHRSRWGDGRSSFTGSHLAFHRDFARQAFDRGWLRLWFLEAGGAAVAAWYGFRFNGVESYYQAGRDVRWGSGGGSGASSGSPPVGFVLLCHSIRSALEDGMREYRFLRGYHEFKYRFAERDAGLETIAIARSALVRTALLGTTTAPAPLVSALRRRLLE